MTRKSLEDLLGAEKAPRENNNDKTIVSETTAKPTLSEFISKEHGVESIGSQMREDKEVTTSAVIDANKTEDAMFEVLDDSTVRLDMDRIRKNKIFIATPCYGGQVTDQYFLSMFRTTQLLMQQQIDFRITTLRNESLITRGRNILTAMFLEDKNMTHLMFIDADIEFDDDSLVRLIAMNKPIIAGAYPKKTVDWNNVRTAALAGEADISKFCAEYAINLKFKNEATKEVNVVDGAIEVLDASTGFFLIKREVIEHMVAAMPELKYNNDSGIDPKYNDYCYTVFDTMTDPVDRRYLSEDYTFCRRAQKLGYSVWIDPNTNLNHVGSFTFPGNIGKLFSSANG